MAQTKKRRRSKHRGNAAGVVEARGRTGKRVGPPQAAPKTGREARLDRTARPPSWRGAVTKAAIGAVILFVVSVLALGRTPAQAAALTPVLFLVYIPLGYYTDRWVYNRRRRSPAGPRAGTR